MDAIHRTKDFHQRRFLNYLLLAFNLSSEKSHIKLRTKSFVHSTMLGTASTKTNVQMNMLKLIVKTKVASKSIATRGIESHVRME